MKHLYILLLGLLYTTAQAQIEFGPYLTYPGTDEAPGKMTVHLGLNINDTEEYYVVWWANGESYSHALNTKKVVNIHDCEYNEAENINKNGGELNKKYSIRSYTITGLPEGKSCYYTITKDASCFTNSMIKNSQYFYPYYAETYDGKNMVTKKDSYINGDFTNSYTGVVTTEDFGFEVNSSFSIQNGTAFRVTNSQCKLHQFNIPDPSATDLTFYMISDTQNGDHTYYYDNILDAINSGEERSFILHGGDYSGARSVVRHISRNPEVYACLPIQVTEGNHDTGYWKSFDKDSIVTNDNEINCNDNKDGCPCKITKEMIWFDKLFHHDFPSLTTSGDGMTYHNYSFDYGPLHVSVLDFDNYTNKYSSNKGHQTYEDQMQWLYNDLESSKDKQWKMILIHYDESKYTSTISVENGTFTGTPQEVLFQMMEHFEVHTLMYGHNHTTSVNPCEEIGDEKYDTHRDPKYLEIKIPVDAYNSLPLSIRHSYYKGKIEKDGADDIITITRYEKSNTSTIIGTYIQHNTEIIKEK